MEFGVCFPMIVWPSTLVHIIVGVLMIFVEYLIPLIIMIYCYSRVIWTLTRRIDSRLGMDDSFRMARKNTIKTCLWISIIFVLCWTSTHVYYILYTVGYESQIFFTFSVLSAFANGTVNPFIYLVKYKDFQVALRKLFGFKTDPAGYTEKKFDSSLASASQISSISTSIARNNSRCNI